MTIEEIDGPRPGAAWSALVAALLTLSFGSILTFLPGWSAHDSWDQPASVLLLSCLLAVGAILVPPALVLGSLTATRGPALAKRLNVSLRVLAAAALGLACLLVASLLGLTSIELPLATLPGAVAASLSGVITGVLVALALERRGLPAWAAGGSSVVTVVVVFQSLYGLLLFNGWDPIVVYRSRSVFYQAMYFAERIAFLPTYWLTKPLGGVAQRGDWLEWLTLAEISFLTLLYGGLVYLILRGRLTSTARRVFGGRAWIPWVIALVLFLLGFAASGGTRN